MLGVSYLGHFFKHFKFSSLKSKLVHYFITMDLETTVIHKELDLIQDVIKRQAANSFQVKTWTMGIVTAVLAFKNTEIFSAGIASKHQSLWTSLILLLPIICFWYLDAFFLQTERKYRELFKWVIANRAAHAEFLYDLNTFERKNYQATGEPVEDLAANVAGVRAVMWSVTLRTFYLIPLVLVLALSAYNLFFK